MPVSTIGIDLAKTVFQVHGVDKDGKVIISRQLRRMLQTGHRVFQQCPALPHRYGGLCDSALLGA